MRKIISLFARNYETDRLVRDELVPGAEWVGAGEGIATSKIDGTCCLVAGGMLFKRYDAKKGKTPPNGFIPAQPEPDPVTGHFPGWLPVSSTKPEDRWHLEGWRAWCDTHGVVAPPDWTYELVGPAIQNDPYQLGEHILIRHGEIRLDDVPRDFAGLRAWLERNWHIEGIVWWRDPADVDSEKVKIKRRDFGLPWPVKVG